MKPMIGIAVSRKTDPRAVGRNIWRRRVKEIFRTRQAELFQDAACFVKIRSSAEKASYAAMEADLVKLFKKAGVWA